MMGGSEQLYNIGASHNACAEGLWLSTKTSLAVSRSGKTAVFELIDPLPPSILSSKLLGQVGC